MARRAPLANTEYQRALLADNPGIPDFEEQLKSCGLFPLKPAALEIFQVNIGYMCNQLCAHCHVDAGPDRTEMMTRQTMEQCLRALQHADVTTLDITGGAPEMHPDFRWFVSRAAETGVKEIMLRSNLTIIVANKKYNDLPGFFAANRVRVISSLPYFQRDRTDRQRGEGVFDKSIEALALLNAQGYGMPGKSLVLDLVYNPAGAFLPGPQAALEKEFRARLLDPYGIHFTRLLALTNLPISRFLEYLVATDNLDDYMQLLVSSFNPTAVHGVMCRNTVSVAWDGSLYDCDFNQMLRLRPEMCAGHVAGFDAVAWNQRTIALARHCFGCTAGAGSSCQGSTS